MEALLASYGSDSDSDESPPRSHGSVGSKGDSKAQHEPQALPPPPLDLVDLPNPLDFPSTQVNRVRSFPHVEGNYALHVFIPVLIPSLKRKPLASFLKKVAFLVPGLHVVDVDIPLGDLCNDDPKLEQYVLGRELHISLGRTVPIGVHQIDSVVAMLRQKLQSQRSYWIEFSKWEVFVNDDQSRSFLSLEVTKGGLSEVQLLSRFSTGDKGAYRLIKQVQIVDSVYRLHGLPEFYKDPRPHISLVWALGDISSMLRQAVEGLDKRLYSMGCPEKNIFTCKFSGIECRIGKKSYRICGVPAQ